jgi:magnesium-transporting ATPase (P-type)
VQLEGLARGQIAAGQPTHLVIDGKTLTHVLGDTNLEAALAVLGSLCTSVVVCRASPSQKARIVAVMREYELRLVTDKHRTYLGRWFAGQNRSLGVRC